MVLNWLKSRRETRETARSLYNAAALQARSPAFYADMGVPDTIDGRFEMTALHVFMVMHVLKKANSRAEERLAQALFDQMFRVTDQAIREMGIGDLSVPRHMKRMMQAFNGRAHAYQGALEIGTPKALKEALQRNVYGTVESPDHGALDTLAHYVRNSLRCMKAENILTGEVAFASLPSQQEGDDQHYA